MWNVSDWGCTLVFELYSMLVHKNIGSIMASDGGQTLPLQPLIVRGEGLAGLSWLFTSQAALTELVHNSSQSSRLPELV